MFRACSSSVRFLDVVVDTGRPGTAGRPCTRAYRNSRLARDGANTSGATTVHRYPRCSPSTAATLSAARERRLIFIVAAAPPTRRRQRNPAPVDLGNERTRGCDGPRRASAVCAAGLKSSGQHSLADTAKGGECVHPTRTSDGGMFAASFLGQFLNLRSAPAEAACLSFGCVTNASDISNRYYVVLT